jgi:hypothetical protein
MKDTCLEMDIGSLLYLCVDDKNINIIHYGLSILLLISNQQEQEEEEEHFMIHLMNAREGKKKEEEEEEISFKECCKTDILKGFFQHGLLDRIIYFLNEDIWRELNLSLLWKLVKKFDCNLIMNQLHLLIPGIEKKKGKEEMKIYQELILKLTKENTFKLLKVTNLDKRCLNHFEEKENIKMITILMEKGFCFDLVEEYFHIILKEISNKNKDTMEYCFYLLISYIHAKKEDSFYSLNSFVEKDMLVYLKFTNMESPSILSSMIHFISTFYFHLPSQLEYSTNSLIHLKNLKNNTVTYWKVVKDNLPDGLTSPYFLYSILCLLQVVQEEEEEEVKTWVVKKSEMYFQKRLKGNAFHLQFGMKLLKYSHLNSLKINLISMSRNEFEFTPVLKEFNFSKKLELYFLNRLKESGTTSSLDWYYGLIEEYFLDQTISIPLDLLKECLLFLIKQEEEIFQFIPNVIRFSNILKIFFFKDEVYQEEGDIASLLNQYCDLFSTMKFENIPDSFFSFIEQLVDLYTYSSYGNKVFTKYLCLFFQWKDSIYRKHILKSLKNQWFLLKDLKIHQQEQDMEVIQLYMENVSNLDESCSSLQEEFIHQIHQYIFQQGGSFLLLDELLDCIPQESILKKIFQATNKEEEEILEIFQERMKKKFK